MATTLDRQTRIWEPPTWEPAEFQLEWAVVDACRLLRIAAEVELAKFHSAVSNLFGPAAAARASEIWLQVFEREEIDFDCLTRSLMAITSAAAAEYVRCI
jgi:hypothetical protein